MMMSDAVIVVVLTLTLSIFSWSLRWDSGS